MRIAVEGCCHGELDNIYGTVAQLEKENNFKIDLLLICGDFQAVRNFADLQAMAVPLKYQELGTFYKYYNREKVAPVLTIIIGGNHEASNYMQELPYGGWVAPNIYYLGYAGIVTVGGLRIGGISGIHKGHDFQKGHFEAPPYTESTKRSAYHTRALEVFRLKQISRPLDVFLSHDWPQGVYHYGDVAALKRKKNYFVQEIDSNSLGSPPLMELLRHLQPGYWFAAHLHVKFAAHVMHQSDGAAKSTKFLALDKCLPRRHFLQVVEIPHKAEEGMKIKLDAEWLTVLSNTNHLLKLTPTNTYMPGPGCRDRYDFTVTETELKETEEIFGGDLALPENFVHTAPPVVGRPDKRAPRPPLCVLVNPQTALLCTMLELTDPNASFLGKTSEQILNDSGQPGSVSDDDVLDDSEREDTVDAFPSYIDSSMDSSNLSGMDSPVTQRFGDKAVQRTPKFGEKAVTQSPKFGEGAVLPSPKRRAVVSKDDEEDQIQAIFAAQRQKRAITTVSQCEDKPPAGTEEEDELQAILAAQKKRRSDVMPSSTDNSKSPSCDGGQQCSNLDASSTTSSQDQNSCAASSGSGLNGCGDSAPSSQCSKTKSVVQDQGRKSDNDELDAMGCDQSVDSGSAPNSSSSPSGTAAISVTPPQNPGSCSSSPSSMSPNVGSLKKTNNSFGMSLLRLDSSGSSGASDWSGVGGQKRSSSDFFGSPNVTSTPLAGSKVKGEESQSPSSGKKLKRRNVSLYTADVE